MAQGRVPPLYTCQSFMMGISRKIRTLCEQEGSYLFFFFFKYTSKRDRVFWTSRNSSILMIWELLKYHLFIVFTQANRFL